MTKTKYSTASSSLRGHRSKLILITSFNFYFLGDSKTAVNLKERVICKLKNVLDKYTEMLGGKGFSEVIDTLRCQTRVVLGYPSACLLMFRFLGIDACVSLAFTISSNPIIPLFYPPIFCVIIVCNFSWDMTMSQEK